MTQQLHIFFLFFFNDTATTEIYTLSLHDALPISINIMTLGGLAVAVGILGDESTVVMENIHSHLGQGRGRAVAVLEASKEVQIPRLLAMLCILAVFVPPFFMTGVSHSLFVPLSLAVGFAMAAS